MQLTFPASATHSVAGGDAVECKHFNVPPIRDAKAFSAANESVAYFFFRLVATFSEINELSDTCQCGRVDDVSQLTVSRNCGSRQAFVRQKKMEKNLFSKEKNSKGETNCWVVCSLDQMRNGVILADSTLQGEMMIALHNQWKLVITGLYTPLAKLLALWRPKVCRIFTLLWPKRRQLKSIIFSFQKGNIRRHENESFVQVEQGDVTRITPSTNVPQSIDYFCKWTFGLVICSQHVIWMFWWR